MMISTEQRQQQRRLLVITLWILSIPIHGFVVITNNNNNNGIRAQQAVLAGIRSSSSSSSSSSIIGKQGRLLVVQQLPRIKTTTTALLNNNENYNPNLTDKEGENSPSDDNDYDDSNNSNKQLNSVSLKEESTSDDDKEATATARKLYIEDEIIDTTTTTTTTTNDVDYDEDDEYPFDESWNRLQLEDMNDPRYKASDWLHIIKTLPRSTILRSVQRPVIAVMIWSTILIIIHKILQYITQQQRTIITNIFPSTMPHAATVSALGLLLVFRTNSTYSKFNEGRHIWENILSITRNFTRMIYLYPNEITTERRKRIFRLLAAYPFLLHQHIQPNYATKITNQLREQKFLSNTQDDDDDDIDNNNDNSHSKKQRVQPIIDTDIDYNILNRNTLPWSLMDDITLTLCIQSINRPLYICDRIGQEINHVQYTDNYTNREREKLLKYVGQLSTAISKCERIHRTAVPLNYARHSLRSLTIWLFTLPFTLISLQFNYIFLILCMGLTSWILYGIYQIGYKIEDPFRGALRLSTLCDIIFQDIMIGARRTSAFNIKTNNNNNSNDNNDEADDENTNNNNEEWKELPLP